jgi:hypothetical protein
LHQGQYSWRIGQIKIRRKIPSSIKSMEVTMKQIGFLAAVVICATPALPDLAAAQTVPAIPPSITTPDKVESRLGTLDFRDGMPSPATMAKVYDNLDFTHAVNAFMNTMQGVNLAAIRKGVLAVGVKDNEIGLFSELMDAKSLFLTANADTVYFFGFIDLAKGPMVFETAAGCARRARRHVVALGHRFRLARPRSQPGRQIPSLAAWV